MRFAKVKQTLTNVARTFTRRPSHSAPTKAESNAFENAVTPVVSDFSSPKQVIVSPDFDPKDAWNLEAEYRHNRVIRTSNATAQNGEKTLATTE